jgi:hypothetical protein
VIGSYLWTAFFFSAMTVMFRYDMKQHQFNLSAVCVKHAAVHILYCGNITEEIAGVLPIFPESI